MKTHNPVLIRKFEPKVGAIVCASAMLTAPAALAGDPMIQRIDHMVPHVSTAPGNEGEEVELFVRERLLSPVVAGEEPREVIVMTHGATIPAVPAFDLGFQDYSWAEALARANYDVFLMDLTGYGLSPKPHLDQPCNVNPDQQGLLLSTQLEEPCEPQQTQTITSESEWDDIDAVVDFVRDLRDVDRVHLIGWSAGVARVAGYAASHPGKVGKLVLFGPTTMYASDGPSEPPEPVPFATRLNTADILFRRAWNPQVNCARQLEPGVRQAVWATIMAFDPVGATWGRQPFDLAKAAEGGISRTAHYGENYGFNAETVAKIEAPVLIIRGEHDFERWLAAGDALYDDLGTDDKTLVTLDCAGHWANWERQYAILHQVSIDWLENTEVAGLDSGKVEVDIFGQPVR